MKRLPALLFALWAWAMTPAPAIAQTGAPIVRVTTAQFILSDAPTPPPDSANWQPQRLPDNWADSRPGTSGFGWYRMRFDVPQQPSVPWAIYVPVLRRGGTIHVNGVLVAVRSLETPRLAQFFEVPPSLLHAGPNEVELHLQVVPGWRAVLSTVAVGNADTLRSEFQRRVWFQSEGVQMFCVVLLALGLSTLAIWWRRRSETAYGYFGLQQLGTALYISWFFVHSPVIPEPYWTALHGSMFLCNALMSLFALRFAGWRWPRIEVALWIYIVTVPVATFAAELGYVPPLGQAWYDLAVGTEFIYVGIFALHAWRRPTRSNVLLALVSPTLALSDIVDGWLPHSPENLLLEPYQFVPLCLVVSWLLLERFISSLNESEQLNAELEQRVQQKQAELQANFQRVQQLEREQAVVEERSRIMGDMHDGIGAQLISTLGLAEHGQLSKEEMAVALRECLDDLRLTIDSLEPTDNDLLPALGNFRYRVDPRLQKQGIALDWRVGAVPKLACLTPRNLLHVLRMLQEAFTNVLKHAHASLIRVETGTLADGHCVFIRVTDNGSGFVGDHLGRGLANMKQRAERIGGMLQVAPSASGTTLELLLPVA